MKIFTYNFDVRTNCLREGEREMLKSYKLWEMENSKPTIIKRRNLVFSSKMFVHSFSL